MAGESCLDRHFGGFQVADFAHHDDVRILPQQRADAIRKSQTDVVLHLHLVEGRLDHFDRVLHGADIDFRRGQLLERGIKRRRFARAGRPGDQDDAVGLG